MSKVEALRRMHKLSAAAFARCLSSACWHHFTRSVSRARLSLFWGWRHFARASWCAHTGEQNPLGPASARKACWLVRIHALKIGAQPELPTATD